METIIEGRWRNGDGARLHVAPEGMTLLDSAGSVIGTVGYDAVSGVSSEGRGRHGRLQVELEAGKSWTLERLHPLQARFGAELIQEQLSALHRRKLPVFRERQSFGQMPDSARSLLNSTGSGVVNLVDYLLTQAAHHGASDIHLQPYTQELSVRYRVDGMLTEVLKLPSLWMPRILARLKVLANLAVYRADVPQEGRFGLHVPTLREGEARTRTVDVRLTLLPTMHGEKAVLRLFDSSQALRGLSQLGMSPAMLGAWEKVLERPQGLVLVTGPSGHGKTTTLYSSLHRIHGSRQDLSSLCTVEDPVEYDLRVIHQTQVNPAVGLTFATGLRTVLRQDPEVIMVGEIRDEETAGIAVRAGLTGHLILSTVHAPSAAAVFARLIDLRCEPFLVASSATAILAQRLVRRLCEGCKTRDTVEARELERLGVTQWTSLDLQLPPLEEANWQRGQGCSACGGTGYQGRVGLFQLLEVNDAVRDGILRGLPTHDLERLAGGRTLLHDGLCKAAEGLTTLDEVQRVLGERQ